MLSSTNFREFVASGGMYDEQQTIGFEGDPDRDANTGFLKEFSSLWDG